MCDSKKSETYHLHNVTHFSIVLKRPKIFFENESEAKLKDWLLRYYKCAKILLDDQNPRHVQNFIGSIINKKDRNGITPLHLASTDWPQSIIKSLLEFGADLSIRDNQGKCPLKKVPESTIIDVLDNFCIKSKSQTRDMSWQERVGNGTNAIGKNKNDDEYFQELKAENCSQFLTNIGNSPVIFNYQLLAPKQDQANADKSKKVSKVDPEMSVLNNISESKEHQKILKHPVIKSFFG